MTEQTPSWQKITAFIKSRTGHFALTYIGVIMFVSITGSIVFYFTASNQLERQLPPPAFYNDSSRVDEPNESIHRVDFGDFFDQRIEEGHGELLERLILINFAALIFGSAVSYIVAHHMLRPIESVLATQKRLLKRTRKFPELDELEVLQNKTIELKPVSLQTIIREATKQTLLLTKKNISIDNTAIDTKVLGNHQLLTRFINILLENSATYSTEQTTIHISTEVKPHKVYLYIRDEGIGIPRYDLPYIFTEFYQADHDHPLNKRSGDGLGLAIARSIIEKNNGKIHATSTVDQGTTIIVEFKRA